MPCGHAQHAHGECMPNVRAYALLTRMLRPVYRRIAQDALGDVPRGARVLDVGTGPGHLVAALAQHRPDLEVVGVDVDPRMVDRATANLAPLGTRATAVVGDVASLPLPDDQFDLVVTTFSLHHWGDPTRGGTEVERVRAPGGAVRVYDFAGAPWDQLLEGITDAARVPPTTAASRLALTPLGWPRLTVMQC